MNNKRSLIFYFGGFELPDKNAAAHRVVNNAKALKALGYDVVFVGIHNQNTNDILKQNHFGFATYSIPYPKGVIKWTKFISEFSQYKKIIAKYKSRIYAFIFYNHPVISTYRLYNYAKDQEIKTFADITEWALSGRPNINLRSIIRYYDIKLRMTYMNKKMTGVISISKYLHRYYGEKSVLVPPLVDISDDKWKLEAGEKNNDIINLIYSGSPFNTSKKSKVKDKLDVFIDALYNLKRNTNFLLNIVGLTEEEFLIQYPNYKDKLVSLDNKVIFHGRVAHSISLQLLKESDFSIFYREHNLANTAGFPTKFVEAISACTAVITNPTSNIKDYLKEGANGFLINDDEILFINKVLEKCLELKKSDYSFMREYLLKNRQLFDYKNYLEEFRNLMQME